MEIELKHRFLIVQMANNKSELRKLRLQVQMSIDGCIAGSNGEMDWMVGPSDYELLKYVTKITDSVDTILLGRKMTDVFISYWLDRMNKPDDPWNAFAKRMIEIQKVVFTKIPNKSEWINTDIATGDLLEEVIKIKGQNGRDIVVYGGASFDSSLINEK
jgi:dihydrofolate reductase